MRIPGTRRSRLIALFTLGALAVVCGLLLYARFRTLYRNLGPTVVKEIEGQLGREVAIGHLDVHTPGRIVLDQVAMAAHQRLANGAMFRARRVVLRYSWQSLFHFPIDAIGSVRSIEIDDPWLLVIRDRKGHFNLQDLYRPRPHPRPTTFRAPILVRRGQLQYEDFKAALPHLPAVNRVNGVEGSVDFQTFPRITALASGVGQGGRAGLIQTSTLIDISGGRWLVQAFAANADAAYWAAYALRTPQAQVRRGRGNVQLVVGRTSAHAPVDYVLNLAVRGVAAHVARLNAPITGGEGVAQITPSGVKLDAAGDVAGMPVQLSGNILDWKHPQVALSFKGSGINLPAVRQLVPHLPALPGLHQAAPGEVDAWLLGPATRLYASGSLTVPALSWRGEPIRLARVTWRYHAGMLELDQIAAAARAGRLTATGWAKVIPSPARLYLTGQLTQLNLAGIPMSSQRTHLAGTGAIHFGVSGTPDDLHGAATVQLSRIALNSTHLNAATARLDYQDGVLYVRSLQAADPVGRLVAAGTVDRAGTLNLQVRALGISVAALLLPFTRAKASGTAYFTGGLNGTVREPRLAGQLQLYAGRVGSVSADYAEGQIAILPDRLEAEHLVLRLYPGFLTVRGIVGGWREHRIQADLQAHAADLSIARLLAMAKVKARLSGTLSGDLAVRGTPTAPLATATARVEDLLVEGARLGTATVELQADRDRIRLRQAALQGDSLAATASGTIGLVASAPSTPSPAVSLTPTPTRNRNRTPNRLRLRVGVGVGPNGTGSTTPVRWISKESPLDLTFAVQKLDLARASTRAGAPVLLQGVAQVSDGTVKGRLGAPVVTARAAAAPFGVNGVSFASLSGLLTYTRDRVTAQDVALRDDGGTVQVSRALIEPQPGKPLNGLTLDASITAFPVQRLIEVARRSAAPKPGSAPAAAPSPPAEIQGAVSGTITARPESGQPGAPSLWTTALKAPTLTVPGYRLPVVASAGSADQGQPLTVGVDLRASYSMAGRLTLEQLDVTRDEGVLQAHGTFVRPGGRDAQGRELARGQIAFRVDASDIPMGLFGPLAASLHPLRGTGELHLDATGPLNAPAVQGSLDVEQLALAGIPFTHFSIPHMQVTAPANGVGSVQIEHARLEEDDKDHPTGEHYLTADGTLPFQWKTNDRGIVTGGQVPAEKPISLQVHLPQQSLDVFNTFAKLNPSTVNPRVAPLLTAMSTLSAVSGTLSGDVRITGTRAQPDTSGSIQIAGGAFQPQRGQTKFDQIAIQLGFTGNRMVVDQFHGRSSEGGTFDGSGDVSGLALGVGSAAPSAQFNLALSLNNLRYTERNLSGYLQEQFRGTLRTVQATDASQAAPVRLTGDWRTPTLSGAVQIRKARLALPASLPQAKPAVLIPVPNPNLRLDLLLDQDDWLQNPLLRMQMAGRVPIRGTLAAPVIRTTLTVVRGDMIFPTARFRVEGNVEIAYAPAAAEVLTPEGGTPASLRLDLTATSRLHGPDPNTGQRQAYDVTLTIQGPLTGQVYSPESGLVAEAPPTGDRLRIEARSDPPLDQQQILGLLGEEAALQAIAQGGPDATTQLKNVVASTFTTVALPTLFVPIESQIENWLGLEEFSVDVALEEPVQLRLTKQIYGPFFATYTRSLSAGGFTTPSPLNTGTSPAINLYTLELYYRISNRFRLSYTIEEPSHIGRYLLNRSWRF